MDVLIGWPGGDWQATLRIVGGVVGGYLFVLWVASVLWVFKDIRSRTRDAVSQLTALGIAVVFPLVGLPVYMVLRPSETLVEAYARQLEQEAILSELHTVSACPNCRRPIDDAFMVCPHCATALKQACRSCSRLLQFSWRHCPYCATARELPRPAAPPAPPARAAEPAPRAEPRPDSRPAPGPARVPAGATPPGAAEPVSAEGELAAVRPAPASRAEFGPPPS